MAETRSQYTAVAILLHWAIAAAVVGNLFLGWWMSEAIDEADTKARAIVAFQLHKSIGLTVLVLTALRLLWRLLHRPPPLPAEMAAWERFAAKATHWAFYALLVVVPLSGWTYVSAQWADDKPLHVPTLWFGQFHVPHLFDAESMPLDERKAVAARNMAAHYWLAWSMCGLLVLHVGAALKHHFFDRDDVLSNMLPAVSPRSGVVAPGGRGRSVALGVGFAAIAVAIAAVLWALFRGPAAPTALTTASTASSATGSWVVDSAASELAFSGVHAGNPFRGRFQRWEADLRIDPAAPENSTLSASIDMASAADGVPLHEESLPQEEWFDVAKYPKATYRSTKISGRPDGGYDVEGTLTIKDRPLKAPLQLTVANGVAQITGKFDIDRTEAGLGMESDSSGEYVSLKIGVDVKVTAKAP